MDNHDILIVKKDKNCVEDFSFLDLWPTPRKNTMSKTPRRKSRKIAAIILKANINLRENININVTNLSSISTRNGIKNGMLRRFKMF